MASVGQASNRRRGGRGRAAMRGVRSPSIAFHSARTSPYTTAMTHRVSLAALVGYFLRLGLTGFGGPVALANSMRRDIVERYGWIGADEYDEGLAIATACPGPLAYQLGVYCGYLLHGVAGALAVGFAFAAAPFCVVVAALYVKFGSTWELQGLFYGVGPVVIALIVRSCWDLGKKTLRNQWLAY